ncbi:peptide/nickel transport system permease protein [Desulfonispora thiosulfatigenes DSM 11270]|uniref:Peptide/nickel transport system permease protein n=1 Tax=Desulfonispora thiosulfatigenes DSM 11270 TaxID=656914 RepID=A0A1W1UKN9_DESTI|nr:ABC transporter permease [Desulfonispora thiosulfatigenes]SMB81593.1 peptide/nickel transport system permease protein [Desulfonispora thiosulfatigenes DSM 11270]
MGLFNGQVWHRLKKNKLAMIGMIIVIINITVAIFAPLLTPFSPNEMNLADSFLAPGVDGHILGTDDFGRDLLTRILHGSRVSLIVGMVSILIGGTIGTVLGLVAGFYGGKIDSIIMRIMDGLFAFPYVLLSIALMTALGSGIHNIIIAVSIINIPGFARIVRGETLVVKEQDYVEAAKALGAKNKRLLFSHILPNCMAPLIVYATMGIAGAILSEAALSFLGLGIREPDPSWGSILKAGQEYLGMASHISTFSGLAILFSVLGFNLFGDGLRDALDPRLKQ